MHRRRRTLVELLTRSLAASGFVYAMVLAYVLPAALLNQQPVQPLHVRPAPSSLDQVTGLPKWKPAHAKRFPGCIDMARWSESQVPATVVVVRRDGDLARVHFDEAFRRATSSSAADDVWTIGACG